jgi:hypothetical protein
MANYQTGPLGGYDASWQYIAKTLYLEVEKVINGRVIELKGSYSVLGTTCPETAAKIIIYERGKGRGLKNYGLPEGVYVLVRTNGNATAAIWKGPMFSNPRFARFFTLMNPNRTLEISPHYNETFAFFAYRVEDLADASLLLVEASRSFG